MQAQPLMLPEGDFALGMRASAIDPDTPVGHGDFAVGGRMGPHSLTIGTFARGQATPGASVVRGSFATGQGGESRQVLVHHPRRHRHEHGHGQSAVGAPALEAGLS